LETYHQDHLEEVDYAVDLVVDLEEVVVATCIVVILIMMNCPLQ
jgi:hypothetical protein